MSEELKAEEGESAKRKDEVDENALPLTLPPVCLHSAVGTG
jgi:hypothetical protein